MARKQVTRNIALSPSLDQMIKDKIASGRYQSASEVVREGLRLLEDRDQNPANRMAQTRRAIELGWRQIQRRDLYDGPEVFAEIRQLSKIRRLKKKPA